jgi:L-asparaginase II
MTLLNGAPAIAVTRGDGIESVHRVASCVADDEGRVIDAVGTIDVPVFLRSTAKPFIAAAIVRAGVAQRFGFDSREIAIVAGSHNGEPFHIDAVRSMLGKMNLPETALQCGPHLPYDEASAHALVRSGEAPTAIHNNCSGKHAGILGLCLAMRAPVETYLERDHPAQRAILEFCARICGIDTSAMTMGTDGCGIPVFAVSLTVAATAFARLATLKRVDSKDAEALNVVRNAMMAHPEYVGGTGEFDTDLMRVANSDVTAKSGAEGVHGLAALRAGVGAVLKVVDGNGRAVPAATMQLLQRTRVVGDAPLQALQAFAEPKLRNRAGRVVGSMRPLPEREPAAYDLLERQARALLEGERDIVANAANIAAFVYDELHDVNWAGFYFMHDDGSLVLGPFGGKPACSRLAAGRGVCGAAATQRRTLVVDDVRAFSDHIACDSASRSEIVVPFYEGDRVRGVLDIDSPSVGRFKEADRQGIEALARVFSEAAYG